MQTKVSGFLQVAVIACLVTVAAFAPDAQAYVGPGAGISVLGALWGLIVGVVMAIGVILFWPIRMMLRKRKAAKAAAEGGDQQAEAADMAAEKSDAGSA